MKKLSINSRILVILTLIMLACSQQKGEDAQKTSRVAVLPYYEEATYTPRWIKPTELSEDFHQIPPFSLVDQMGSRVTEKDLDGKVTVVNFFFTVCPGICPKMMGNMSLVQERFLDDEEVLILSHSVMPKYDSVPILRSYADDKGITKSGWHLLTGDREAIYDLGRNRYFVEEDLGLAKDPDEFIHTENFVLVDQDRRIRGIYNGLNKTSVQQLIADVQTLKRS